VAVPWAREGSGFTLLFQALVMLLCREMPMAAVAVTLGEHGTRLWRVATHYVEAAHAKNSWRRRCDGSRLTKPVLGAAIAT
jgi:transposase